MEDPPFLQIAQINAGFQARPMPMTLIEAAIFVH